MRATALATLVLSLWSTTVPALGRQLGLNVEVAPSVEIADHVIPGIAAAAAAAAALALLRRRAGESTAFLFAAGVVALAGLWMTTTHVPLVVQATQGIVPWPAAIWHSAGGPLVLALGVALFVMKPAESQGVQTEAHNAAHAPTDG